MKRLGKFVRIVAVICLAPVVVAVVSILISLVIPSCHISEFSPEACGRFLAVSAQLSMIFSMLTVPLLCIILLVWAVAKLWRAVR